MSQRERTNEFYYSKYFCSQHNREYSYKLFRKKTQFGAIVWWRLKKKHKNTDKWVVHYSIHSEFDQVMNALNYKFTNRKKKQLAVINTYCFDFYASPLVIIAVRLFARRVHWFFFIPSIFVQFNNLDVVERKMRKET